MSSLKHDIHTIFATLNTQAFNIQQLLPILIKGYRAANADGLLENMLRERQLELLELALKSIPTELAKLEKMISKDF